MKEGRLRGRPGGKEMAGNRAGKERETKTARGGQPEETSHKLKPSKCLRLSHKEVLQFR